MSSPRPSADTPNDRSQAINPHREQYYAHSLPGRPPKDWEPLRAHLMRVAELAGSFARKFKAEQWGRQVGLWHDVGKYHARFQDYLFTENGLESHLEERSEIAARVDHSTAGAKLALEKYKGAAGWLLAYAIAGHHAGLPDATNSSSSCLAERIGKRDIGWQGAPDDLLVPLSLEPPPTKGLSSSDPEAGAFKFALFGRMLFSCLVDADFLATEAFLDQERSQQRRPPGATLGAMLDVLNGHLEWIACRAPASTVNSNRQEVLAACRLAAAQPPGLFALTVPTGGGKTLASLAFALEHARKNSSLCFERVIYAIPFTSIIEQTAAVFAEVFHELGEDVVLEHHSNIDPDDNRMTPRSRLAAENWDAPLVVTTNVQFFESLFAAKPSKCRKLHRMVKSIIILDEVQTLPVNLLRPCLAVLRELVADYHCTIVLCSATQPAFEFRRDFDIGFKDVRPIIPTEQTAKLYERMRRTEVVQLGQLTDEELLACLGRHEQFLCIVNTRKHAAALYDGLRAPFGEAEGAGLFHLSTWMCGAHRSYVIARIKGRLKDGLPCRVVSTSLIEAGVDVDFPVVYRALAGVDAIAQAAGRCNREGKAPVRSVFVFAPVEAGASQYVRGTMLSTMELTRDYLDLLSLDAVRRYFELHFWKHSDKWDLSKIVDCFKEPNCRSFDYRTAAERFRMIEEYERPIIVPWGRTGEELVQRLRSAAASELWRLSRKLQRFTVGVGPRAFERMVQMDLELIRPDEFGDRFPVLTNMAIYDQHERGLNLERMGLYDPESLCA